MSFLDWLFGRKQAPSRPAAPSWQASERGNPTILHGRYRVTVFQQDGGWKYVLGDEDDNDEPYFSEKFQTEGAAKRAALRELGF